MYSGLNALPVSIGGNGRVARNFNGGEGNKLQKSLVFLSQLAFDLLLLKSKLKGGAWHNAPPPHKYVTGCLSCMEKESGSRSSSIVVKPIYLRFASSLHSTNSFNSSLCNFVFVEIFFTNCVKNYNTYLLLDKQT